MRRFEDLAREILRDKQNSAGPGGMWPFSEASSTRHAGKDAEKFTKVPNEILEKVISFGFTRRELLIVLAIIRKTCGWHKELDRLSYSKVSELTGIDRRNVKRVMHRLRDAGVFQCGNPGAMRAPHEWGIDRHGELWNREVLRSSRRSRTTGKAKSREKDGARVGVKLTPRVGATLTPRMGAKLTPKGEGQISPPQKKEKKEKEIGKNDCAAKAARPSSSSSLSKPKVEKQEGSIGSPKDPPLVERPSPAIETQMAPCDQVRIVQLCGELEAGGVNSYPWVGGKRRKGAIAAHIIRVLEKAVVQRPVAAEFDVFAERLFEEIRSSE